MRLNKVLFVYFDTCTVPLLLYVVQPTNAQSQFII